MWMLTGYANLPCPKLNASHFCNLPPLSPCSGKCVCSHFKPDLRALPDSCPSLRPPHRTLLGHVLWGSGPFLPPAPCHWHSLISSPCLSTYITAAAPNLIASFFTTFHLLPVVFTVYLKVPFWNTKLIMSLTQRLSKSLGISQNSTTCEILFISTTSSLLRLPCFRLLLAVSSICSHFCASVQNNLRTAPNVTIRTSAFHPLVWGGGWRGGSVCLCAPRVPVSAST